MTKFKGRVVWFCSMRGFGFIHREGEPDVFVHKSVIPMGADRELVEGAEVEFDVSGPEGLQAENVALVR